MLQKVYKRVAEWKREGFNIFAFRLPTTKGMLLLENEISGFNELEVQKNLKHQGQNGLRHKISTVIPPMMAVIWMKNQR